MNILILVLGNLFLLIVAFFVAISRMKQAKKLPVILLLICFGVVGSLLYVEAHFTAHTGVLSDMSEEEILTEMPDIAISQADLAMMEELLDSDEIAEAFVLAAETENGIYEIPTDKSNELLAGWIPDGFEVWTLSVATGSIFGGDIVELNFLNDGKQRIGYRFGPDFEMPNKFIGLYKKDFLGAQVVTVYDNTKGKITKTESKRIWFDWLKNETGFWDDN